MAFRFVLPAQNLHPLLGSPFNGESLVTAIDSSDNLIWVGTSKGLFVINKKRKRLRYYTLSNTGYSDNVVTSLRCQEDGCVWIGTNNGLIKYDNYGFITYSSENSNLPSNCIYAISIGKDANLRIQTADKTWLLMHKDHFHILPHSSPDNNLQAELTSSK
jgi:hypothetical protein